MSEVRLSGVTAGYGRGAVLRGVDLTVAEGTTTAVLGGSGSGKTTLLRIIAGFLRPDAGQVVIGGRTVAGPGVWVPPERRGIGYVRQEGGLFPHLTVAGNIAFGLPWPRRRHRNRVLELLDLVGLPADLAERRPDQLSGGQQQRVALARALAPRPGLVLLDEPFSSLDTGLRAATREATARALRAAGATALLVTHDQDEALSFADEVAIMGAGRFRQVARPEVLYREPVDVEVASFLGDAVLLSGVADDGRVSCRLGVLPVGGDALAGAVRVMIRPEQISLTPCGTGHLDATVRSVEYFGHDAVVGLDPLDDPVTEPLLIGSGSTETVQIPTGPIPAGSISAGPIPGSIPAGPIHAGSTEAVPIPTGAAEAAAVGMVSTTPAPDEAGTAVAVVEPGLRARVIGLQPPSPGDRVGVRVVGSVRVFPG
ncbi:ABC transporter ATP-binding protein [Raineyella sp. LH-20]|uniref:ABC transporter ATP-binding protein n=1 Tax=Raineyella sp. LH-20 TaxID=3081204 RepID=UPI0029550720|nr:ABC transporter ATP-binding protein [Raineyella sp. LH-20]WOP18889.1 ABC transporter ATP-binding protein [Raineyella sp. LH-20]